MKRYWFVLTVSLLCVLTVLAVGGNSYADDYPPTSQGISGYSGAKKDYDSAKKNYSDSFKDLDKAENQLRESEYQLKDKKSEYEQMKNNQKKDATGPDLIVH